jgi:hypothetical protein
MQSEGDDEDYEELKVECLDVKNGGDLRGDVFRGKKRSKDMNAPELIEELEEFF